MIKKPANPWNAVSIVCTSASCAAAQALKGRRYLSAEAPRLPLADCTSADACRCVYRKHPDRRAGPRREADSSDLRRSNPNPERRRGRGRRSTDR
jgi:hypothetical protein